MNLIYSKSTIMITCVGVYQHKIYKKELKKTRKILTDMDLCKFLIFTAIPFLQPLIQQLLRANKTCLCSSDSETCQRTSFLVALTVVSFLSLAINFHFIQGCFGISLRMNHISFLWNWLNIRNRAPWILTSIEKLHSYLSNPTFPRSAYPSTGYSLLLLYRNCFHVHGSSFEI